MKKYLIILLTLFFNLTLFCNNNEIDSLLKAIEQDNDPLTKIQKIRNLVVNHYYYESESLPFLQDALKLATDNDLDLQKGRIHIILGNFYLLQANYELSMDHYVKANNIGKKYNDDNILESTLINIALVYSRIKNYEKAIEVLLECKESNEKKNNTGRLKLIYNNLGIQYANLKEYQKSIAYYKKTYALSIKSNDSIASYQCLNNIGETKMELKEYDSANYYYNNAYDYINPSGKKIPIAIVNLNIGKSLLKIDKPNEGLTYLLKSQETFEEHQTYEHIEENYELLAQTYETLNDYKKAYLTYIKLKSISDTLNNIESKKELEKIKTRYELEKEIEKNAQLEEINESKQKRIKFQRIVLIIGTVVLLLLMIFGWNQYQLKKLKNSLIQELQVQNKLITDQKTELEELNNNKTRFFSIIAHDLNSPITATLGLLEILMEQEKLDYDNTMKYLHVLHRTSKSSHTLLNNLLLWSKSQMGGIKPVLEKINLLNILKVEIDFINNIAKEKAINIELKAQEDIYALADKSMISFVFRNLISNAVKFSHPNSIIRIILEHSNDTIKVIIQDSGIGIPLGHNKNIFRIGKSKSSQGTKGEKGSGLGLPLCKDFIKKQNGEIWFESNDTGTTFYFTLPKVIE